MIRLALVQRDFSVGDLTANREKVLRSAEEAVTAGADLVVYPELALCGYPPEDLLFKKHFVRECLKSLKETARRFPEICAIVGCLDKAPDGQLRNAAALIESRRVRAIYHKQELPNYGVFDEARYFTPGREDVRFALGGHVFGISICEDIWISGGVCSRQARKGARVLINLSSSPFDGNKLKQRHRALQAKARETGSHVVYVNLVGGQDELVFDGGSLVMNPDGKVIHRAPSFEEDLCLVDLDIPATPRISKEMVSIRTRNRNYPPLLKKKIPVLSKTEAVYKALVLGTRDYVIKNGFNKVIIGLSGGIDSSLVAVLAVDALGSENVVGMTMPSRYSSSETRLDAARLAESLGIEFIERPIDDIFAEYLNTLDPIFKDRKPDLTEENIQARIRGNLLMALSNKFGWLVLTTGNKSELAVGYCTLYGDMSGGFAVIKDVPKTLVFELCRYRNSLSANIPQSVLDRPPSAELRENQKDEDSLPPYEVLDEVLRMYVEDHAGFDQISRKFDKSVVRQVLRLIDRNEYKRRQSPPGVKITPRAFGKDWRLPITNRYQIPAEAQGPG